MDASRMSLMTFAVALITAFGIVKTAQCAVDIGFANKVNNKVYGTTLLKRMRPGDRIYNNQRIRTSLDSAVDLSFLNDSIVYIGELSDLTLDNMVYDIHKKNKAGVMQIFKGVMRYVSGTNADLNLTVKTNNASIGVRGTVFDLMAGSGGTEVAVHQGTVHLNWQTGTKQVVAGQVFSIPNIGEAGFKDSISAKMEQSISKMIQMLGVSLTDPAKVTMKKKVGKREEAPTFVKLSADRSSVVGKNLNNILFMDLSFGRIVIEMMPNLAPNHIKRIKQLVREKFYDGLKFHNVIPGFVAETGDPTGTGVGGSGTKVRAEITQTPFTRGLVGMKRDRNNPHTADSQFFILLGDAQHLEGKYTAWGRVIHGMLLLDRIHKGSPPDNPDHIIQMRVASDLDK